MDLKTPQPFYPEFLGLRPEYPDGVSQAHGACGPGRDTRHGIWHRHWTYGRAPRGDSPGHLPVWVSWTDEDVGFFEGGGDTQPICFGPVVAHERGVL